MSSNLRSALPLLKTLAGLKTKKFRSKVMNEVSGDPMIQKALREISKNFVKRKIKLNKQQIQGLRPHKRTIAGLAKRNVPKARRKKLVVQSGGALPFLIPIVATIIGELIRNGARK